MTCLVRKIAVSSTLIGVKWWDDEKIEEVSSPKRGAHIELIRSFTREHSAPVGCLV